ncbi:MAG: sulfate transporter CysZ [Myxococcales bacterium]|nr:MAG: sulfate transporter CysZ [Myxococcales bacterium]
MNRLADWLSGFRLPFAALSTVRRTTALWRYVAVPLLINTLLFLAGFALLWIYRADLVELVWTYPAGSGFWATVKTVLWYGLGVLVFLAALLTAYFLFTPLGCLIASPFNDWLAGRAERLHDPALADEEVPFSMRELARTIKKELVKFALMLLIVLVGALLNLIPVAGILLFLVFALTFGAWFLAIEYLDYPMARHGYTFSEIAAAVRRARWRALGFGAAGMLMMMIPFLNLLCIPVCVVAATAFFIDLRQAGALPPSALGAPKDQATSPTV